MAIKIKPSNIFNIDKISIPRNSYQNITVAENNYELTVGDVSEVKTFNFYEKEVEISDDGTVSTTIKDVSATANEGMEFVEDAWTQTGGRGRALIENVSFDILEKTHFDYENYDETSIKITSHSLRRETHYYRVKMSGDQILSGEEFSEVRFEKPFIAKSSSSPTKIDISYLAHVLQKDPSYPNDITYILSESVSIEGQYFKALEDTTASALEGVAVKKTFNLPTNELFQAGNTKLHEAQTVNYSDLLIQQVFSRYEKGKETATLLCSVGKYYDLSGNLVVDAESEDSTIPPLLKKYDIVVPYVMGAQGEKPLSENADGTPKKFQIIGVGIKYGGVVKQEITIQEFL